MSDKPVDDRAVQVADQCRAVAHLATVLAKLYADHAKFLHPELVDMVGARSAELLEMLGDELNNMDAVTESDAWIDPLIEQAQRLWPATPAGPDA